MAAPQKDETIEYGMGGLPLVRDQGLNTNQAVNFGGAFQVDTSGNIFGTGTLLTLPASLIAAASSSFTLFVNSNAQGTYQIAGVSTVFGTASSSGTLQVEVATGTQAVGSGTNQLTGTVSLAGTANTTVNGTVIASPTTITAGNRVNLILGGTLTSLANCAVTVVLQRLS